MLDRLTRYKDISEEKVLNYCSLLCNNIKNSNKEYDKDPLFILLNNALIAYKDNAPKLNNVTYLQTKFIDVIKSPLVEKFRHIDEAIYIIDNCRKATWLYNETIERTKMSSETFQYFSTELMQVSDKLKELTEDLKI